MLVEPWNGVSNLTLNLSDRFSKLAACLFCMRICTEIFNPHIYLHPIFELGSGVVWLLEIGACMSE